MTTQTDTDEAYRKNSKFWTTKGDKLLVVGDYLGRLPSILLLNPKKYQRILDAGCGAGFIARRLAKAGAEVYGCDRNQAMLQKAIEEELRKPRGITYNLTDISKALPYSSNFFDGVACVAVLIHDSPEECKQFFCEAKRTLKDNGKLVISSMHPALYMPGSPNRTDRASWAQYKPLENLPMDKSQKFEEDYVNSNGEHFLSTVWNHPEKVLTDLMHHAGLEVVRTQSQYVTREVLDSCKQTGEVGYPGFLQIVARKLGEGK